MGHLLDPLIFDIPAGFRTVTQDIKRYGCLFRSSNLRNNKINCRKLDLL